MEQMIAQQASKRNHYPLTKTCPVCELPFVVNSGQEIRNLTCSKACGNVMAGKTRQGEAHWNWGNPHQISGDKHQFFGKHHTASAIESNRAAHLGNLPWNKGFVDVYSQSTIDKMRASHKGMHLSPSTEFTKGFVTWNRGRKCPESAGPRNPNWKGGITPELKKLRNSTAFRVWREGLFRRDDFTCQHCGSRGVYLHPHHINNFSRVAELRFDPRNGITFCRGCHAEFHAIYSRHNNTIAQLATYLKINMEKLMRRLNDEFGGGFIEEYIQKEG